MADLTAALTAAGNGDRAAQQQLEEWLQSNYAELAKALAQELANESKAFQSRQLAAIYLKNTLYGKTVRTQQEMHTRWKRLNPEARNAIKESLLNGLRSSAPGVPRYAAMAAAEVACVELPFQEWPVFVSTVTENIAQTASPEIQHGSVDCFGFTLERIAEVEELLNSENELATETVDKILTSIVSCVHESKPDSLRLAALKALKNSLLFVRKNMENKAERDFIMTNAIMAATKAKLVELRSLSFACLDQVADLYYEHLQDYMTAIFDLTTTAINSDPDESVQMAAIEFWSTVAAVEQSLREDEELARESGLEYKGEKSQHYTKLAAGQLVNYLLQSLTKQGDDEEADEIGLASTGSVCLETVSQTIEGAVISLVTPFVEANIRNPDWHFRDAAIVSFSCIMDGPRTAALKSYITTIISFIVAAFNDQNETVRQSAVHCIATICRLHVTAIEPTQVHGILVAVTEKLKESPRVAAYACTAIYTIAKAFKSSQEEPTNVLSQSFLGVLQTLFQVLDRGDFGENNLLINAMEAAAELIMSSASDTRPVLKEILPLMNERTAKALNMGVVTAEEEEQKNQLLSSFCIIYNALFQRLTKEDIGHVADQIVNNLLQILNSPKSSCQEEVLLTFGSFANVTENDFVKYFPHVVNPMIAGIRSKDEVGMCSVSIGLLADVCGAVGGSIVPHCDNIMGALTDVLHDTNADRSLKPLVISCFGDVAMAICGAYEPYMKVTSVLLMQAAQQNAPVDDEDLIEFVNALRCAILEAYSGILIGLSDGQKLNLFLPTVQEIGMFLEWLANPTSMRDASVLQKAVTLLGDIAREMGKHDQVKPVLQHAFVMPLLRECARLGGDEGRQVATWTHQQVTAATM